MSVFEAISVALNVVLTISCAVLVFRARRADAAAADRQRMVREEAMIERRAAEAVRFEYLSLGESVAEALKEVRKDIDRNYEHTHEGHLLDRLAYELEKARGPVRLSKFLMEDIRAVGCQRFTAGDEILFSGALNLAWYLHAQARKNAGELHVVVQESCGNTDRAAWLGKTLALYMRICGGDKEQAISSLCNVLQDWRYTDLHGAVLAAKTVSP